MEPSGQERPAVESHRFLTKILVKSNDFERRGRCERVARRCREPKIFDLPSKSFKIYLQAGLAVGRNAPRAIRQLDPGS